MTEKTPSCDTLDGRFSWVFEMKNRLSIEHKRETPKKIIEHNKYGKTAQSLYLHSRFSQIRGKVSVSQNPVVRRIVMPMGSKNTRPGPEKSLVFKSQWDHHSHSDLHSAFRVQYPIVFRGIAYTSFVIGYGFSLRQTMHPNFSRLVASLPNALMSEGP